MCLWLQRLSRQVLHPLLALPPTNRGLAAKQVAIHGGATSKTMPLIE